MSNDFINECRRFENRNLWIDFVLSNWKENNVKVKEIDFLENIRGVKSLSEKQRDWMREIYKNFVRTFVNDVKWQKKYLISYHEMLRKHKNLLEDETLTPIDYYSELNKLAEISTPPPIPNWERRIPPPLPI